MVKGRKQPSMSRRNNGSRKKRPETRTDRPDRGQTGQENRAQPQSGRQIRTESAGKRESWRSGGADWLYGTHAVLAALRNPARRPRRLMVTRQAAEFLHVAGLIAPEIVPREDIDRVLPGGVVHQGLALLADPLPAADIEDLARTIEERDRAVAVVLDRVSDPRNVGAILRSAAAFGVCGVVVTERHAPGATGALAKAASGALETVPLVQVVNLSRALDRLKAAGMWCLGLDAEGDTEIGDADLTGRIALVLGAEGAGLRRLTRDHCDLLVRLPMMADSVPSLNVSNAAAVALYAAWQAGQ